MVLNRKTGTLVALVATGVLAVTMLQLKSGTRAAPRGEPDLDSVTSAEPAPQPPRVNVAAAKAYAEKRQADALCLIALGRATGDTSWLQRALAEHPDDPRVQLERWNQAKTPEEKLAAARALQQAAPDNPLGSYLEAGQAFERRDLGAVARLMVDAEAARAYDAYTVDILLETDAAYRASGLDAMRSWEAAMGAYANTDSQVLSNLHQLGNDMGELQHIFVEMGYWDEADFMFDRTLALGEQLEGSAIALESLSGLALQAKLLGSFDAETLVNDDGTRAGERLAQIQSATNEYRAVAQDGRWMDKIKSLDNAGWEQFRAVYRRDGELAAMRWLTEQK